MKNLILLLLTLVALQGCKIESPNLPSGNGLNVVTTPIQPKPDIITPPSPPSPLPKPKSACLFEDVLSGKVRAQLFDIQDKNETLLFNFQHYLNDKTKFDDVFFSTFLASSDRGEKEHISIRFLRNESQRYKIEYDNVWSEQNHSISNIQETKYEFPEAKMQPINTPEYDISEGLTLDRISKNPLLIADDQTISILSDLFLMYQTFRTTSALSCDIENFQIESERYIFTFRDSTDLAFTEKDPYPITSPNLVFHELKYNECPLGIDAIDHPTNFFYSTSFLNQIVSDDVVFIEPKIRTHFNLEGHMMLEFSLPDANSFKKPENLKILDMEYDSIIISSGKKDYASLSVLDSNKGSEIIIKFSSPNDVPEEFTILFMKGRALDNPAESKFYWTKKIKTKPVYVQ